MPTGREGKVAEVRICCECVNDYAPQILKMEVQKCVDVLLPLLLLLQIAIRKEISSIRSSEPLEEETELRYKPSSPNFLWPG